MQPNLIDPAINWVGPWFHQKSIQIRKLVNLYGVICYFESLPWDTDKELEIISQLFPANVQNTKHVDNITHRDQ